MGRTGRQQTHLRHLTAARESESQDTSPGVGPPQAKKKKEIELSGALKRAGWSVVKKDTPGQRELISPKKQRRYHASGDQFRGRASREDPGVAPRAQFHHTPAVETSLVDAAKNITERHPSTVGVTTVHNFELFLKCAKSFTHSLLIDGKACGGHLVLAPLLTNPAKGHGGEFIVVVQCSNPACKATFQFGGVDTTPDHRDGPTAHLHASLNHTHQRTVGFSILTSFLLSGTGQYTQYEKFMSRLGLDWYSQPTFQKYLRRVQVAVQKQLQREIDFAIEYAKGLGEDSFWSWARMVITCDGTWNIAGANAPHHVFMARAPEMFGAIIGIVYKSRADPNFPFLSTSKSAETLAAHDLFKRLVELGCGAESLKLIIDGDASVQALALIFWMHALIRACCGHLNNVRKALAPVRCLSHANTRAVPLPHPPASLSSH